MTDLIERIKAAIDEEKQVASAAIELVGDGDWEQRGTRIVTESNRDREVADYAIVECIDHIARHDPARVLRQVEGARKLLESHGRPHECQHLTARGDHSVVDGKPWAFFEPAHTDETGGHCDVILALAEMFGVEP